MSEKRILDVTCGSRSIWFQKNHPAAIYCDNRAETFEGSFGKQYPRDCVLEINPDIVCDFRHLPFESNKFALVVFDPPHIKDIKPTLWLAKHYGVLTDGWEQMLHDGFSECMRVLRPDGVLILKWSDISITTRKLINAIGQEPLFGHRSGKKMNTHWLTFMKLSDVREGGGE
jgi:SAM-dependent methyltransferase